jgi:SH3-like domain-containing protein
VATRFVAVATQPEIAPFALPTPPAEPEKPPKPAAKAPAKKPPPETRKKPAPVVTAPPHPHAQPPPAVAKKPEHPKPPPVAAKPPPPAAQSPPPQAATAPPPPAMPAEVAPAAKPPEPKGSVTSLPLPRWASLRADEVNLRVGPGMTFPIEWQYHRRDLPVQILREVEVWRLIQDEDGVKGWVHSATLTGRRSFIVKDTDVVLRSAAAADAAPVARLKPGVIGRIRACEAGAAWCEVQVADYKGWLRRDQFFGTDPGEAVGN